MLLWAGGPPWGGGGACICVHVVCLRLWRLGVCVCVSAVTHGGTARGSLERPVQAPYFKSKTPTLLA